MFEYTSPAVNTTRQIIATIILVCLALIFVGYYVPTVSRFYEESKVAKNLFDFIGYTLVLTVAILDLLHAGKAKIATVRTKVYPIKSNRFLATLVLTVAILDLLHAGKANEYRKEM